ncbi:threonine/serine exporter family protein [Nocardioides sp. TF02-7]|uniref:threonine/serine ThrE exporter family protein n=1 Tax=Nocardioides sp. TF02-7 TaxID=2917724 RepID=UPI0031F52779
MLRLVLRLGRLMIASGAQANEVEASLRRVLGAYEAPRAVVMVSYTSLTVSYVAEDSAEAITAVEAVRRWDPGYHRLVAAAELAEAITRGEVTLTEAEKRLAEAGASPYPYPRWLGFAAPALLSMAVTVMFGGRWYDALATLGIGLAVQPALERIDRSELSAFFRVAVGVSATTVAVVLLVAVGVPIQGGLVLTGSLLRFLPGAVLVAGMRDFLDGALASGTTRLVEVVLLGAAVAISAGLVLTGGRQLDVHLTITAAGPEVYPLPVLACAGAVAVLFYACQLGVPAGGLAPAALLGCVAVLVTRGIGGGTTDIDPLAGTLLAALVIGATGQALAQRSTKPAALWLVPAILPLLPAPATLIPLLAETESAREALRGQALGTAFCIGVGVAVGSIAVESWSRYRRDAARRIARLRRARTE